MSTKLPPDVDARLAALGALQDPVRRALYLFVLGAGRAVGRDEAAGAVGVRRALAAFHLDRLADDGLLSVEFRRLTGRSGPGAGRPAKLYRVVEGDREVSLPPRSYALVGELLAEALEASRPGGSGASAEEVARTHGRRIGTAAREELGARSTVAARRSALDGVLARFGYQPQEEGRDLQLRNCPFHALAVAHRSLVCGVNHAFLSGVLDGLDLPRFQARLEPPETQCCVVIGPTRGSKISKS
jgi:predicted ArsR family transcriptional regulator